MWMRGAKDMGFMITNHADSATSVAVVWRGVNTLLRPGWVRWLFLALLCIAPSVALAQPTYLACTSNCPSKYYWETAPLTRAAPSAAPVQGTVGAGMLLTSVSGAYISLCAASGQTLAGAGTLQALSLIHI